MIRITPAPTAFLAADLLDVGQEIFPRRWGMTNTGISMTSGTMRLTYFTARKSETSTQIRVQCGSTAAGATPTLIRFGLYAIDAAAAGTLVASTPNDTTLLTGTNAPFSKAWSTPIAIAAGARYAVGFLVVTGATAPTLCGLVSTTGDEPSQSPRQSAALTGQTDLPASFTNGSLGTTGSSPYAAILP